MSQQSLNVSLRQIFPRGELNFTSEAICNWVFEHREDVLRWLQPPGTKSRLLEQELSKGPALLLFLPFDPLGSASNPVLQQVSRPTSPGVPFSSLQVFTPMMNVSSCVSPSRLGTLLSAIILARTAAPARMEAEPPAHRAASRSSFQRPEAVCVRCV